MKNIETTWIAEGFDCVKAAFLNPLTEDICYWKNKFYQVRINIRNGYTFLWVKPPCWN